MAISFEKAFGVQSQALELRGKRTELIASNLANADTPNYKARDIDFKAALSQAEGMQKFSTSRSTTNVQKTDVKHLSLGQNQSVNGISGRTEKTYETLYRNPISPSLDGNTVETHVEQAKFAENALQYQATLNFLSHRITGLMSAIKGE
ncbi:MAG: flagellar basal body rod protein FlgB [Gammaproteobacteria bacterium]|nr:MAG: flagellar basal body rod protein FlgB [Gammaproteobacteria bacterium]